MRSSLGHTATSGIADLPSALGPISLSANSALTVTALAAGSEHSCALLSDGTVKCWGSSSYGQLGYGNQNTIGDNELPSSVGPVSVSATPGVTVTALDTGAAHTCALLSDHTVKCWGFGVNGALGYGNPDIIGDNELPSSVGPVSISNAPGVTVTALALGAFHSCALLSDGTVTCWGDAHDGEPGAGSTDRIGDDELPSSVGPVVLF